MFFLTILKKEAREKMGYLIAENPLRDSKENDEHIDIRLEGIDTVEEAKEYATETAKKYQLRYWELSQIVHITGWDFTSGDWY